MVLKPGIEEVNMFTEDGGVLHFNTPKVQAAVGANTYASQRRLSGASVKGFWLGLSWASCVRGLKAHRVLGFVLTQAPSIL